LGEAEALRITTEINKSFLQRIEKQSKPQGNRKEKGTSSRELTLYRNGNRRYCWKLEGGEAKLD